MGPRVVESGGAFPFHRILPLHHCLSPPPSSLALSLTFWGIRGLFPLLPPLMSDVPV